jgi:hypothetical protein|tara:strand:- start:603 stop:1100 length:498 start_codon:yes stop_codon:yes gene_type:complete
MTTKKLKDNGLLIIGWLILLSFVSGNIKATELLFQFKNPSFSGIGTSAHYLTIDEQESSRKQKIAEDIESALNEAARELDNTTLAKFVRNLESRIFSRLSQDLAESLFNDKGGSGGSIDLEGNTINFLNTGTEIVLTILDIDGTITEIRIPIGSFGICADAPCVP